ncbi:hypothetical protein BABINDRAFT_163333 [Babjeviella inositovora NRRL Y-12698]|uniref:Proteasome assembly chaperone 3 n=1 Tax=Babjeviella inositovora NRRL Y-12698 TaxID=984486 RepID=A0A1E3QIT2_9ASCO|nr:uncharacterized protein BABINDRAFT_163333 [Babjeviella inositovora NRRL Y-12698]ODQ77605.1 hypothetical protein BABINDRAFT_163333 [Babjeviella inositovora NRRL Y-12698]
MTTYKQQISPAFGGGDAVDICLTLPEGAATRVPITLFVSPNGVNEAFGPYIYAIPDPRTGSIYHTVLNGSDDMDQMELTKRLATIISKKYRVPSYVSISGKIDVYDSIHYIKAIVDLIDEKRSV